MCTARDIFNLSSVLLRKAVKRLSSCCQHLAACKHDFACCFASTACLLQGRPSRMRNTMSLVWNMIRAWRPLLQITSQASCPVPYSRGIEIFHNAKINKQKNEYILVREILSSSHIRIIIGYLSLDCSSDHGEHTVRLSESRDYNRL